MSNLAAQELQSFVRRIEALDDEIRALNADKSEVFKEVKSSGFAAKTLRKVIAARRMDSSEREAADEEFDLYWHAIHGTDQGLVRAHVENIEEFPVEHDEDGVILEHGGEARETAAADGVSPSIPSAGDTGAQPEGGENVAASFDTDTTDTEDTLLDDAGKSVEAPASAAPLQFVAKPLRPYCLNPGNGCGGMGRKHCLKCEQAHQQAGAA